MPLYKTIKVNRTTTLYIWKIEESFQELSEGVGLTNHCQNRVDEMLSEIHKRGFMSVRQLLKHAGYTDFDLFYDDKGKPHLKDGKHISITHSYYFSGIIIGDEEVGIDIEKQREKILTIANKFTPLREYRTLANDEAVIRKLTIVWGAKEAIYKIYSEKGVSFLNHINVKDFQFDDVKTTADLYYKGTSSSYTVSFTEFEGFTCVYAMPQPLGIS